MKIKYKGHDGFVIAITTYCIRVKFNEEIICGNYHNSNNEWNFGTGDFIERGVGLDELTIIKKDKTMEITKDNIEKVLEFNGIDENSYGIDKYGIDIYDTQEQKIMEIRFIHHKFTEVLERHFGKLKPLPEFDFKQYLLDSGEFVKCNCENFIECDIFALYLDGDSDEFSMSTEAIRENLKKTKPNADRAIAMAKIGKEMEYASQD